MFKKLKKKNQASFKLKHRVHILDKNFSFNSFFLNQIMFFQPKAARLLI